ncbi:MAG: phosphoribosyltransferase [archaeon]
MVKKFKVSLRSWENIWELSRKLSSKIIDSRYKPDVIIALARGGFVVARNLCDMMYIKDLVSLKVEHWGITATPDGQAVLKYPFDMDLSGKKVLVVDDITDTGESLRVSVEYVKLKNAKEVRSATLQYITSSSFKPDYFVEEITGKDWVWVLYPWCYTEDMCNLIGNILEEGKAHLDHICAGLEEHYEIKVDKKALEAIMLEMERRDIVERIEEKVLHWQKKGGGKKE